MCSIQHFTFYDTTLSIHLLQDEREKERDREKERKKRGEKMKEEEERRFTVDPLIQIYATIYAIYNLRLNSPMFYLHAVKTIHSEW